MLDARARRSIQPQRLGHRLDDDFYVGGVWPSGRYRSTGSSWSGRSTAPPRGGVDVGALGALYRPRYFHGDGIAVHGYHSVPAHPASHGCVRVTEAAMDWIWANNLMPLGSAVWVH